MDAIRRVLAARQKQPLKDTGLVPAAVLFPLYLKEGQHTVLFHQRTKQVAHHKGEVSLPGGARDPQDESLWHTALREAHEEMGIRPEDVALVGEMEPVTTRTGFLVHPFVATIPYPYPFRVNPVEVAQILEVPLKALLDRDNWREEVVWLDGQPVRQYSYAYGCYLIYGATAKIVRQFLERTRGALAEGDTGWKDKSSGI